MADIISPILSIVSVLCSSNNRCCYLLGLQENKDVLHTAMEELKATRDDVKIKVDEAENNPNERMKRTEVVDNWLQRAQNIEGEVGEILTKVDQEIEGRCFGGNFPINCWSAHKIGKLVNQELASVKEHRSKGDLFLNKDKEVAYKIPLPSVQEEPMNTTVGMESMFDKVWRLLDEDKVRIMGLYGCGGVGKTTLLKQINNAFLKTTTTTTHVFDVVILVVVSKVINIDAIQMEIGKRLGLSSTEADKTSIFNALTNKSFVLLLDDIWERVDLQSIGVPSPSKNNKSKVVFTTRSEIVCGHMDSDTKFRMECLPWDKAWTLFQEKVGNETLNFLPKVHKLAEDVARECGGLPLVLITIGRAMSSKKTVQEWKHAITTLRNSASEFPGMGDEVLPLLNLSYGSLRNDTIKSCFLYCALFPEDHSMDKTQLIDYWIGEGLISLSEFNNLDDARNKGHNVIGDLKGASLLESGNGMYEETEVKMHDTIWDLALWIAHDRKSRRDKMLIIKKTDLMAESSWDNAERIYLIPPPPPGVGETEEEEVGSSPPLPPLKSPKLITLIHDQFCKLSMVPQNFFEFTPLLRVLDLSYSNIEFPISITGLVELRYLSLSCTFIQELPEELGKLVKLNYLDLSRMWSLVKIPNGLIGSLLELRVLNLFDSRRVDWDLGEVYKLKHLNDVGISIKTQHNLNKLLSNQNLQMCTRHLNLERIPEANMGMGIEQQQHLGSSCFQNLIQIKIMNCKSLKDLTWVGYVPNLITLTVYFCEELEEMVIVVDDDDFGGGDEISTRVMNNVQDVFKSLKTLEMGYLPKLKSICRNALAFPCLEEMVVSNCPQLKKLPFDYGSNLNDTLQKIAGGPKWWSELQWEEDNNNNNELLKSKFLPYFEEGSIYDY